MDEPGLKERAAASGFDIYLATIEARFGDMEFPWKLGRREVL